MYYVYASNPMLLTVMSWNDDEIVANNAGAC